MARVVRFHKVGGPEVLQLEELEVAPPGEGEVQINIKALGLNRAESMFRRGQYLEDPKLPARLGYEAAGTVSAIGPGGPQDLRPGQVGRPLRQAASGQVACPQLIRRGEGAEEPLSA
jgi:NADPH:quinone reductase-like Zn-dependent oxidoreductase